MSQHSPSSHVTLPLPREESKSVPVTEQDLEAAQPSGYSSTNTLSESSAIPQKCGNRLYRYLRWNFGSVYRRIFTLAFIGNIITIVVLAARSGLKGPQFTYQEAATAVSANILAGIIVRNEHFVNAIFLVFGSWPKPLPFVVRRHFAKVYSYGGIHSGCNVAATIWFIAFIILFQLDFDASNKSIVRDFILLVSYCILLLLVLILVCAHPNFRIRRHNSFENVHRFMGWSSVLLFWALTMLLAADAAALSSLSFGMLLVKSPSFWMLIVLTMLIIYPWTRLRLRDVKAEVLSDHCVKLDFNYADVFYGQAVRITDAPLKETHAFAVIPYPPMPKQGNSSTNNSGTTSLTSSTLSLPLKTLSSFPGRAGQKGFSLLISNAGDWTSKIIRNPPTKIYTRGAPQYGVLRIAGLFNPCLIIATGSGIGPCLSLFVQQPNHPVRIIWSSKDPEKTYGKAVMDVLYRSDPNARIIDTTKEGKRPDLVREAMEIWRQGRGDVKGQRSLTLGEERRWQQTKPCEAVVIISNQKVTQKVVYGLESRGVPAYGAIFDS
ncbi:hypothetical protein DL96DRAFT_863515 [Flagelloscypha sp. PMI_526]|nr:hypothetical protein DL96DRAFT_863515 [Flagelloscypha sp. PMI_526]